MKLNPPSLFKSLGFLAIYTSSFLGLNSCTPTNQYNHNKTLENQNLQQITNTLLEQIAGQDKIISKEESEKFLKKVGYWLPINKFNKLEISPVFNQNMAVVKLASPSNKPTTQYKKTIKYLTNKDLVRLINNYKGL
ncbi:MAG: hypothetical protein WC438_01870 [Candidatus Pacearchaeota archaeon]